jgi:hypothetical protein
MLRPLSSCLGTRAVSDVRLSQKDDLSYEVEDFLTGSGASLRASRSACRAEVPWAKSNAASGTAGAWGLGGRVCGTGAAWGGAVLFLVSYARVIEQKCKAE